MMQEPLVAAVRALITFMTILLYARIIGKQQLGNFTMFDYINGITIGSIAATLATDLTSKAFVHWVALTVFIILTVILQFIGIKSRFLSKVQNSEPVVIMENGKILENNLRKSRITMDELMTQLRVKNIFSPAEVNTAILEPDGSISVMPFSSYQPVQKKDLNIPLKLAKLTTEVVVEGEIIPQNLKQRQKDIDWLMKQLDTLGIKDLSEIMYAAILPNDSIYVDRYEDGIGDELNISDYPGPY